MSSKPKVLIQLDPDSQASSFDAMVAIDSGIDHLVSYSSVTENDVTGLTHGAMFTRGGSDLKHTALFFGGSNVAKTEALVAKAQQAFFGPVRVSLMSDPNGSNTTAAAAVLSAQKHRSFAGLNVLILAGTGPVGQRIARLIASMTDADAATQIQMSSRQLEKAEAYAGPLNEELTKLNAPTSVTPVQTATLEEAGKLAAEADVIFAAGAAGITLLDSNWTSSKQPVMVDLNAVPPAGIAGIEVTDCGAERDGAICYGAIGVGGLKMKIHKQAIKSLFDSNSQVLDTAEIYRVGQSLQT